LKPAPFELLAARTAAEAVDLLSELGDGAKPLAGGQSLLPMMIMRLAQPTHLIDLNQAAGFAGLVRLPGGGYRLGPLVRHLELEQLAAEPGIGGYLGRVAPVIAHLPVRVRGTVAGSLAHADPASEWCTALLAAGASVTMRSAESERTMAVEDFLQGSFTTALLPNEVVAEVNVPAAGAGWGLGFAEMSRRPGDFALALAAAALFVDGGLVTAARVVIGGMEGGAARCGPAEDVLTGVAASAELRAAASDVAAERVQAYDDGHTSASHRRQLVRVVVRQALDQAAGQAGSGDGLQ
jgi:carbon-monoxide dehydrogenase medium subunit